MFLATVTNNLDAKGRVSVPADFRMAAEHENFNGIIIWPALNGGPFYEGAGYGYILHMQSVMRGLPLYSKERDALQNALFGEARKLGFDSNGRVTVPKDILERIGADSEIAFVGQGDSFQIWAKSTRDGYVPNIQSDAMQHLHHLSGGQPSGRRSLGAAQDGGQRNDQGGS